MPSLDSPKPNSPAFPVDDLGATLREARERRGLTLEEVERHLRIRPHILEALERGDLESLASEVQARGFLRNYADFLGLEPQFLLEAYDGRRRDRKTAPRAGVPVEPAQRPSVQVRSRRPRWLSPDLFIAAGVSLAVVVLLIWGGGRVMAAMRDRTEAEVVASGFLVPTASHTPGQAAPTVEVPEANPTTGTQLALAPGATPTPSATPTFLLAAVDRVDLRIVVQQRAWILVEVDGREAFRGRVAPGDLMEYQGERLIEVLTSNGAALRIIYEGQDQGLLGELGQVVRRLWSLQGILTPTPTATATASPTPRFAPTLTGTATP